VIAVASATVLVLAAVAVMSLRARVRAEDRLQATLGEIGHSMERLSDGLLAVVERAESGRPREGAAGLAVTLDLEEVLRQTAGAACRLPHADASAVRVTREDGEEVAATYGLAEGATGLEGPLDPPDRRPWRGVVLSWLHDAPLGDDEEAVRSALAVPIEHAGERLGTLAIYSHSAGAFGHEDAQVLAELAAEAAPAIANARRYLATLDLVTTDALTRVRNRHGYDEALAFWIDRSRRTQRPLSLLLVDLDDFGLVNKRFSLPAGDAVLVAFAETLREVARASDVVCRRGGEEFAVILPETECTEARRFHQRLRVAVAATEFPHVGALTFSAGLTELREGDLPGDLDLRASELVNVRKASGKDGLTDDCGP
jgi:diguanylate cyclase (GGDEF)-like protein